MIRLACGLPPDYKEVYMGGHHVVYCNGTLHAHVREPYAGIWKERPRATVRWVEYFYNCDCREYNKC